MKRFFLVSIATVSVVFASSVIYLFSQVSTNETQTVSRQWFSFEPNEEFTVTGSRYFIEDKSQVKYYSNIPNFLRQLGGSENSLGVRFSWDRRGENYADIVPSSPKLFDGRIARASLWVWGGNFRHDLSLIFERTTDGYAYSVPMGKLDFYGWKRRTTSVPASISTKQRAAGDVSRYSFTKFRVYSDPRERVNNIYVFLDNFDIEEQIKLTDFDGAELQKVIFEELGGTDSEGATSSSQSNNEEDGSSQSDDVQDDIQNDAEQTTPN